MKLLPPILLKLHVEPRDSRRIRLWLPLFLLWPLLLILGVLAIVITALTDAVLIAAGQPYHRYTSLLVHGLLVMNETRGTTVKVHGGTTVVDIVVI